MQQQHNDKRTLWVASIVGVFAAIIIILLVIFSQSQKADMVIYGNVYTGTNGAQLEEAVATRGDNIIYVGTKADADKYIASNTRVFDYGNKLVMAGITDGHTHINMATEEAKYQVDISSGQSVEEYQAILKEYIAAHPNNEMYLGMGWDHKMFGEQGPTKEILDAVSPDKPIFIKSLDAHSGWANSKMLELVGINRDSADPVGGKIEKDQLGNPNGCLRETAIGVYVKPHLKVHSVAEYKELIKDAQEEYASLGYTAYVEIFTDTDEANSNLYQAYKELDQDGQLLVRVHGAWAVNNTPDALEQVKKIVALSKEPHGEMFELTDIKFFLDGVAETGTAFLSAPYTNDPNNYGLDRWAGEESTQRLVDCVTLTNQNNLVAHFHAIGDAAVTKGLDVIQAAKQRSGNNDVRNAITHLEFIKDSDKPRFKELNVVAIADLAWGEKIPTTYKEVEVRNIGEERAANAYPYKDLVDAGATVSFATDYPPGAFESPFLGFQVATSRSLLEIESTIRNQSQSLPKDEVLRIMTYGGAYQMNQEKMRGTLEVGKKADIIIVDTNLLTEPVELAPLARSVLTIVNNKLVYPAIEK